jgi:geranylgeranyl diphosphate synthase type II
MMMDLETYLKERRERVDRALERLVPGIATEPALLHEAMRYSLFAGGKRIRPILAIAAVEVVGGNVEQALPYVSAIELIHTYSLVHDDLPAMDNDDFRRGRPTSHKKFDEPTAVLVGDALLTAAFEALSATHEGGAVSADVRLRVIRELSGASGSLGMVGGQFADIRSQGKNVAIETLQYIHTHKTGALIRASVRIGALLGGADGPQMEALTAYGEKVGLAFQIADDLLDVEGRSDLVGKRLRKDRPRGEEKITYPGVMGVEESRRIGRRLVEEAIEPLDRFDEKAEPLRAMARYIMEREK